MTNPLTGPKDCEFRGLAGRWLTPCGAPSVHVSASKEASYKGM
jgi:hypothetical protein